jgi:hypothetical protein
MAETIPIRSVLVTDYGDYDLPQSVVDKINCYPRMKFISPFDFSVKEYETVDMNHPPLARYYRLVSRHMARVAS